MPARPIHRFGADDRLFRGARPGALRTLGAGDAALFGLAHDEAGARAVRDASWFAPERASPATLVDLGDTEADAAAAASAIRGRGAHAYLMGGSVADAVALVRRGRPGATILLSARLDMAPGSFDPGPRLAIGAHDLLPAAAVRAWRSDACAIVPAIGRQPLAERVSEALATLAATDGAAVILDAGVVDTGHAAGASDLNVGGMTPLELLATMKLIAAWRPILAMAVVGLEPARDPRGHSELIAAEVLVLATASLAERRMP